MQHPQSSQTPASGAGVEVVRAAGRAPVVVVCEHASPHIPEGYAGLGLAADDRHSHAVWDPGAEPLARALAARFEAPMVLGRVSRLVHDCNRPAGAESACPEVVERIEIPGNRGLSGSDRAVRARAVYEPFHGAVETLLAEQGAGCVLVTVHSFSPTWHGEPRDTEIGLLHDAETRIAHAMMERVQGRRRVDLNEPYSAADGVTHTLRRHAPAVRSSVMIEVRNDLLAEAGSLSEIADSLSGMLGFALRTETAVP